MTISKFLNVGLVTTMLMVWLVPQAALGQVTIDKDGLTTTSVHLGGPTLSSWDYYGSGNDDNFAEYGLTTWNFTSSDFGGPIADITSMVLTLTVNDRSFSDGARVEIFATIDTEADLGGGFANLSYNSSFTNGIDNSQYVNVPLSMGVFSITEMAGRAGGEVDVLNLDLSGIPVPDLVVHINNGIDFQVIVAATASADDITYSGVGNTFDPGEPNLEITATPVPEPASLVVLGLGALAVLRRRKK